MEMENEDWQDIDRGLIICGVSGRAEIIIRNRGR
jgi:hypothetical protein